MWSRCPATAWHDTARDGVTRTLPRSDGKRKQGKGRRPPRLPSAIRTWRESPARSPRASHGGSAVFSSPPAGLVSDRQHKARDRGSPGRPISGPARAGPFPDRKRGPARCRDSEKLGGKASPSPPPTPLGAPPTVVQVKPPSQQYRPAFQPPLWSSRPAIALRSARKSGVGFRYAASPSAKCMSSIRST